MEYSKPELQDMMRALDTEIFEHVKAKRWAEAHRLAQLRDKVQKDIDMRK
jgi:hypothetical protein